MKTKKEQLEDLLKNYNFNNAQTLNLLPAIKNEEENYMMLEIEAVENGERVGGILIKDIDLSGLLDENRIYNNLIRELFNATIIGLKQLEERNMGLVKNNNG